MIHGIKLVSYGDGGVIPPRTKKNSPQIIPKIKHPVLVPSKAFTEWAKGVIRSAGTIQRQIEAAGIKLPIATPVAIKALVYRDRNVGDWSGFIDAIGDVLQTPLWRCTAPVRSDRSKQPKKCGQTFRVPPLLWGTHPHREGKKVRDGLGIITDDSLIQHWDGSRLLKDANKPRVELSIEILPTGPEQPALFDEDAEVDMDLVDA